MTYKTVALCRGPNFLTAVWCARTCILGGLLPANGIVHDPTSTSSDEDDIDWADEDMMGVSKRRLRFGCELALMQLIDLRFANVTELADEGVDGLSRMSMSDRMSLADRMSIVSDIDGDTVVTTASRRRRPQLRMAHMALLRKNKVSKQAFWLQSVSLGMPRCSDAVLLLRVLQVRPRVLYYTFGKSKKNARTLALRVTYRPTANRVHCTEEEKEASLSMERVLSGFVTSGMMKVRLWIWLTRCLAAAT